MIDDRERLNCPPLVSAAPAKAIYEPEHLEELAALNAAGTSTGRTLKSFKVAGKRRSHAKRILARFNNLAGYWPYPFHTDSPFPASDKRSWRVEAKRRKPERHRQTSLINTSKPLVRVHFHFRKRQPVEEIRVRGARQTAFCRPGRGYAVIPETRAWTRYPATGTSTARGIVLSGDLHIGDMCFEPVTFTTLMQALRMAELSEAGCTISVISTQIYWHNLHLPESPCGLLFIVTFVRLRVQSANSINP